MADPEMTHKSNTRFTWEVMETRHRNGIWESMPTQVFASWCEVSECGALVFWDFVESEPYAVVRKALQNWDRVSRL